MQSQFFFFSFNFVICNVNPDCYNLNISLQCDANIMKVLYTINRLRTITAAHHHGHFHFAPHTWELFGGQVCASS